MKKSLLVTGCAGFIGMHVCKALLDRGDTVIGIDNLNCYYDVNIKKDRLDFIEHENFTFHQIDLSDFEKTLDVFNSHNITQVCHLAAQAGVRYSITDPFVYIKSNVDAFLNILEIVRHKPVENLVYASSSSVYGGNSNNQFSVEDRVDTPISLYAATKRSNELFAHVYHHLFNVKSTGLRFFTVYGPWGRPDMACYKFSLLALSGKPIDVYNFGNMWRDFTYIDDIVAGILSSLDNPFDYELFNLGNSQMVELNYFIDLIEKHLGIAIEKKLLPIQPGDVPATNADIDKSRRLLAFDPKTSIEEGIDKFFEWFFKYHKDILPDNIRMKHE